jgi:hypothetical protein
MNLRTTHLFVAALLLFVACRKDDVRIEDLTTNPFDADHGGPPLFEAVDTYIDTETIPGVGTIERQVIRFRVRTESFRSDQIGQPYQVFVLDLNTGASGYVGQSGVGEHVFTYLRNAVNIGTEVCLELRLANNFSVARPETICVTL